MTLLRNYSKTEWEALPCDPWDKCPFCEGRGMYPGGQGEYDPTNPRGWMTCDACEGHGSGRGLALDYLKSRCNCSSGGYRGTCNPQECDLDCSCYGLRCEDCRHPMSEGTWEGDSYGGSALTESDKMRLSSAAEGYLRRGVEPRLDVAPGGKVPAIHYSLCDEECQHLARNVRWRHDWEGPGIRQGWVTGDIDGLVGPHLRATRAMLGGTFDVEASWRQVDARRLSWDHDMQLENLAVLCLRCFIERVKK